MNDADQKAVSNSERKKCIYSLKHSYKIKAIWFFIPAILQSTFNDNAIDLMVRLAVKNALLPRSFGIAQNVVWENGYQVIIVVDNTLILQCF